MKRSFLLLLALTIGCSKESVSPDAATRTATPGPSVALGALRSIPSPAAAGTSVPYLFATKDGTLLLSWMSSDPARKGSYSFRFAEWKSNNWSEPRVIAEGDDFFVNWADTPSLVRAADGSLFAHWLKKTGKGSYDYAINVVSSKDGGATWSKATIPHGDTRPSEYGFVSIMPQESGNKVDLAWLDGRDMIEEGVGTMAIRFASIDVEGNVSDAAVLDTRVCECCQTGMARAADGPVVVYRDRSEKEVRDTSIVRHEATGWSAPTSVHDDGWVMPGCPVNGPQVVASGKDITVAWFTAAEGKSRVLASFSEDGGRSFSVPVAISSNASLGRVDLLAIDDDNVVVSYMEPAGEQADVVVRLLSRNGTLGSPTVVAKTGSLRASGFPRLARVGDEVVVAWTDVTSKTTPPAISIAALPITRGAQ